ncbi:insulin-like growth factor-binding protein 5 [Protopterus annectens]|uniref:insulin-like growth factor-binding protein 5 n=1 Tax=Protopterus annectens TaxID=7888 RepID=UPI001CFB4C89|nr:insulin-like growth factor-binding protein 5 [Protopterus annectens]
MFLCMFLLFVLCLGVSQCRGSYVHCEACDEKALSLCPPTRMGCELVKEPGCGCCMTCALSEGFSCGVYTEPCAHGLRCLPRLGEEKPLHALLHGRGVCINEKIYWEERERLKAEAKEPEKPTVPEITEDTYSEKVRPKPAHPPGHKYEALLKQQRKKLQSAKLISSTENVAHPQEFYPYPEIKMELGPCSRHIESALRELKAASRMVPKSIHLPNCDRKGFYKRKQCKPSRGRKRGLCWCVDKYGMRLPGSEFIRGDAQCQGFDTNNSE